MNSSIIVDFLYLKMSYKGLTRENNVWVICGRLKLGYLREYIKVIYRIRRISFDAAKATKKAKIRLFWAYPSVIFVHKLNISLCSLCVG